MLPGGIRLFGKTDERLYGFGCLLVRCEQRANNIVAIFILLVNIDGLEVCA